MAGMVTKSGSFGLGLLCDLVLVVNKNLEHDAATPAMRLLVIDSNSYKLDSEIIWIRDAKKRPTLQPFKPTDKFFTVCDSAGKSYKFVPKDKLTAYEWATTIDALAM